MARLHAEAALSVSTAPSAVFARLADYRQFHQRILPSNYHDYTVEQGGSGAGTVVRWVLHIGNHRRPYHLQVSEPTPGAVLLEQDTNSSFHNRWEVTPDGSGSHVHLSSDWEQRSRGFPAFFERVFAPRSLARLHQETLRRLAAALGG